MIVETDTTPITKNEHALHLGLEEEKVLVLAEKVVEALKEKKLYITAVESCTGGALANAITNISGASEVLQDSFITYANKAKINLGVPSDILDTYTVYSVQAATAMAEAGLKKSVKADVSVGITGSISRPDPHNPTNSLPGEIYVAVSYNNKTLTKKLTIPSLERPETKQKILQETLQMIADAITEKSNYENNNS